MNETKLPASGEDKVVVKPDTCRPECVVAHMFGEALLLHVEGCPNGEQEVPWDS